MSLTNTVFFPLNYCPIKSESDLDRRWATEEKGGVSREKKGEGNIKEEFFFMFFLNIKKNFFFL